MKSLEEKAVALEVSPLIRSYHHVEMEVFPVPSE